LVELRVGDWVEVLSQDEILATLASDGTCEGLPFMPQMAAFCGRRFQVSKRAHKVCDTVNATGGRRMRNAVFLEGLQCDGQPYGGCEMECRFFWKNAWLKAVDGPAAAEAVPPRPLNVVRFGRNELEQLALRHTINRDKSTPQSVSYSCQATAIPDATTPLSVWEPGQYIEDYRSGNATLREIVGVLAFLVYDTVAGAGLGLGSAMRWLYDRVQSLRGGHPYPVRPGKLPLGAPTPAGQLNLEAGETVRVKSQNEVLATVTEDLKNRGMGFHAEMVPNCERTFRVEKRLRRLLNEKTGHLVELKNPCVVLAGVPCAGHYSRPLLCPRMMAPYWREVWLERTDGETRTACPQGQAPNEAC
jgi:hypothetical protein